MAAFWQNKTLAPSFHYARALTAQYARSFYFSSRLLPVEKRWATYALYGFCRYADNLIDLPRPRSRQELLQELSCLAGEITAAYRSGESEHPIIKSFIFVAQKYGIPEKYAQELIKGVEMDAGFSGYESFAELSLFTYRVAGVVGLMMTHILGYQSEEAFPYAEKLGIAMQLTNILRDIQEDKRIGRIYIPAEELKKFSVSAEDIMNERMTPQLRRLMEFQIHRAHTYYREAEPGIAMLDVDARFSIYTASRIYRAILHKIEQADYNPFTGRVFISDTRKLGMFLHEYLRRR
ncbi:MAG TPA: phytoene/squalene synthase family protein [bacterium]|nr:phytoene/squalene synthase family protein [bacterium]HPN34444.1 phytoene/squalene synthase family protein [bacterium]